MKQRRVNILGVPFLKATMTETENILLERAEQQEKTFVVTANPEIVMHAREDSEYRKLIAKAHYITADGIGVVKGAQILGDPLPERVAGYDLMVRLLESSAQKGYSVFLLGAKEEVLTKAENNLKQQYPALNIVGSQHGYFDWKDPSLPERIKQLKPDFIFVALGFPRQEKWIAQHLDDFESGIFIGIGGSIDVFAGVVERAPQFWQKLHLEWFYRLMKQPSRWRRMLALPQFAFTVIAERLKGAK